ncbi:MAG TPA: OmpH family outer membrane protein [Planctomycetota bacterium]|jgi:Skp family chaperone for outer membrane proteins|nr:OmpH family outer membrane protein [Planctomycetota bacterium]
MIPSRRGFLSGGLALAGGLGPSGQGAPAPLRVGVVNVRRCFEKERYVRMKEGLEELGKLRDALTQEGEELQKKIAALADLMGRTPRNGELYVEKLRQRAHAEYDLKLLQEVGSRKVRDRLGDLELRIHADLRRAVAQVARALQLDLVLRADEPRVPEEDPEAQQRAASRDVLFHQESLDVTTPVLERLNADWAKAWTCETCKRKVAEPKCPDCGKNRP